MKTIQDFKKMKSSGQKISLVTSYDFWSASIIDESSIDGVLVGDSAAMVMHGFESTVNAEIAMMCYHVNAVKKGLKNKILIADFPFLAHKKGVAELMNGIDRIMKAGAQAVKIEGAAGSLEIINGLVNSGVPVMGHLGLTPQYVNQTGGYKLQGKEKISWEKIILDAVSLQEAGAFALVLEMVPSDLARTITEKLEIPTIGIGAGLYTDGQILVLQDLLGLTKNFEPKFLRKYLNGFDLVKQALENFNGDVKMKKYPSSKESY